eukprot:PITA_27379
MGASLGQEEEKLPYAIYFISENLSKVELNYIVTEKELLAVVHSLNKFRHYITCYQTFVHIDHVAIKYLMNKPDVNARIIRWLFLLQQFDLTIVDKPGNENVVSDFRSRMNMPIAQFPPNFPSKEKSKIVRKSTPFTWIGGNLLKLGPIQILRRCVREEEVFDILLTCHGGPYGGHFATKRTTLKVLQVVYYWPTLHQDVKKYISQCDWCQRMGKPTPRDEMPLQPQVTFDPFNKWGMGFIGPIKPPSKQKQHIIVCTDYLNKWAKTKAIKASIEENVDEFLRENVFYKFGYPRELVTYQGNQFTSSMIEELLSHHKIKHRTSTPYHPQANGQAEVTNRALENILTKLVSRSRKDWAERLVEATWAYNTTWKTTIGFTLYELVYGKKALLSIEFEYNTLRMVAQLDLDLSHAQKERLLHLNGLDEFRMQALLHTEIVQLQRNIWHDKHIKEKQFQEGN